MASSGVCGIRVVDRRHHQRVAGGQALGQVVVAPPAGEEDPVGPDLVGDGHRVLVLPLARVAAPDQQGRGPRRSGRGPGRRRGSRSGHPLGCGEAARRRARTVASPSGPRSRSRSGSRYGTLPGPPGSSQPLRVLDQPAAEAAPAARPASSARGRKRSMSTPFGNVGHPLGLDAEHGDGAGPVGRATRRRGGRRAAAWRGGGRARSRRGATASHRVVRNRSRWRSSRRRRDPRRAPRRRRAWPPRVVPSAAATRGPLLDGLDQLDLGAVQVGDHGHVAATASGDRVVLGREVVEVEHVGRGRRRPPRTAPPTPTTVLGQGRVDGGEHDVGGVARGPRRRGASAPAPPWRCRRPRRRLHRGGVVEVVDVDAGEEGRGVGALARAPERPGDQRDAPAGVGQRRPRGSAPPAPSRRGGRTAGPSRPGPWPPPDDTGRPGLRPAAEVDGNRTRRTGIARPTRFEGGGCHQVSGHLRRRS